MLVIKVIPFECDSHFKQMVCGEIMISRANTGEGWELLWMAEVVEVHWAVRSRICWL